MKRAHLRRLPAAFSVLIEGQGVGEHLPAGGLGDVDQALADLRGPAAARMSACR